MAAENADFNECVLGRYGAQRRHIIRSESESSGQRVVAEAMIKRGSSKPIAIGLRVDMNSRAVNLCCSRPFRIVLARSAEKWTIRPG